MTLLIPLDCTWSYFTIIPGRFGQTPLCLSASHAPRISTYFWCRRVPDCQNAAVCCQNNGKCCQNVEPDIFSKYALSSDTIDKAKFWQLWLETCCSLFFWWKNSSQIQIISLHKLIGISGDFWGNWTHVEEKMFTLNIYFLNVVMNLVNFRNVH